MREVKRGNENLTKMKGWLPKEKGTEEVRQSETLRVLILSTTVKRIKISMRMIFGFEPMGIKKAERITYPQARECMSVLRRQKNQASLS